MPRKAGQPWYRSENGAWYVTFDGKQIPLGVSGRDAEAHAWAALQALLALKINDPQTARTVAEAVPVFTEAISHRVEPGTLKKYAAELNWLAAHYGTARIADLTPTALEKAAAAEDWSDSHRSNVLYTVQGFVRWAGRGDFKLSRPPKESRGAESVIPPDLYERVLRETTGDFHQYCRALWHTGARPGEVAGLTAEGVDWANGCAVVKKHKTRRKGKNRTLHFSPEALKVLTEQLDRHRSGLLFRGADGTRLTARAVVGRFLRLSEKLGKAVTAYCFRHTYITRALEAGIPDAQVAALVGHTSTAMIHKHYSHISANGRLLGEVAAKLDSRPGEAA